MIRNKGFILIIIGAFVCCTFYGVLIGVPLILIGVYFIYNTFKKFDEHSIDIEEQEEKLNKINELFAQKKNNWTILMKSSINWKKKELQKWIKSLKIENLIWITG